MKKKLLIILLTISLPAMASSPTIEKLLGQFDEKSDQDFVSLDKTVLPVNKKGMYLQKSTTENLIKAYQDFKKVHPDIPFIIVSATRNYQYQDGIWNRKWDNLYPKTKNATQTAKDILRYSSMPGSSRHHWGSDFDITSVDPQYFVNTQKGKILYQWLRDNMPKYGFCQPYNEGRQGGYQLEQWHWSYKPLSKEYLHIYQNVLEDRKIDLLSYLSFKGHDQVDLKPLITEYVLTVNPDCK